MSLLRFFPMDRLCSVMKNIADFIAPPILLRTSMLMHMIFVAVSAMSQLRIKFAKMEV